MIPPIPSGDDAAGHDGRNRRPRWQASANEPCGITACARGRQYTLVSRSTASPERAEHPVRLGLPTAAQATGQAPRSAATCAQRVCAAITVRDGSPGAATAERSRHGEHHGARVNAVGEHLWRR